VEVVDSEILSDYDVTYIERKLLGIIKTLSGSRHKDVSAEIKGLADVIDMSGRNQ